MLGVHYNMYLTQIEMVPFAERVNVEVGDMVGVHYEDGETAVIPYYDSRDPSCCGLTNDQLSSFYSYDLQDDQLQPGIAWTLSASGWIKRLVAIQAFIGRV